MSAETAENEGTPTEQIEQSVSEEVADGQNSTQPTETESVASVAPAAPQTARERVPKDKKGNPIYEQTDADTAWDAIVEETEGNVEMAQSVTEQMLANKKAALEKLQKGKAKAGANVAQIIANEKKHQEAIAKAEADVKAWERISQVNAIRQQKAELERAAAEKAEAEQRKAEEARILAEQEEQARIEREQLNGVPDMVDDIPADARARGFRRVNGHKVDRQGVLPSLQGKEVGVKFANDMIADGHVAVIEAETLQPSHLQGQRNPAHFIDEAQPKERNDEASIASARKIASNIRPEEITTSVTAYTGAPTVNMRGEAIQGNSRSDALRVMWAEHPDQAEKYKQYLIDHAEEFGLNAEEVAAMERPVLVNMLDVSDTDAINLGQYVAQDTESGGTERIKPKNVARKMGSDIRSYANILLRSSDEEASFSELVDKNGVEVLKWMNTKGYITPTQYASAFDSKGNMTAEAKNDLRGILYQSIFQGGNTQLEEQFNAMPAKAQKAILATAYRDYDSPESERMIAEIQSSIRAYYALSHDRAFVDAKNYAEAKEAMLVWSRQYQMDDVTGESFLPSENFSNFALELAVVYKGWTQTNIQSHFNNVYDLVQGTKEASLFEEADNIPRALAEAIKETFNIEYNGQLNSNSLAVDSQDGQAGERGSDGDTASGERAESGEGSSDSGRGADATREQGEVDGKRKVTANVFEMAEEAQKKRKQDELKAKAEAVRDKLAELGFTNGATLPKGYKWSDGKKYGSKGETITVLVVGDDIYLRDNQKTGGFIPPFNINDKNHQNAVIKDFRQWPSYSHFVTELLDAGWEGGRVFEDAIANTFKNEGIAISGNRVTRPLETKYYGQEDGTILEGSNQEGGSRRGGVDDNLHGGEQTEVQKSSSDNRGGDNRSFGTAQARDTEGMVASASYSRRVAIDSTPLRDLRARIRDIQRQIYIAGITEDVDVEYVNNLKEDLEYAKEVLAKKEGNKWGVEDLQPIPLSTAEDMFNEWNDDADVRALFDRVFEVFKQFGINVVFDDSYKVGEKKAEIDYRENLIRLPMHSVYSDSISNQDKANLMLHEMIHGVAGYVLHAYEEGPEYRERKGVSLSDGMMEAARQLNEIFRIITRDKRFFGKQGVKSVHEMVSELSDPEFRSLLKETTIWDKIVNALKQLLGIDVENNALDGASKALDYILDNADVELYNIIANRLEPQAYGASEDNLRFREKEEPKELIAVHNISEGNLKKVLEAGSLIMPSIAITKADMGHTDFGEISLLFDKSTINPSDRRNKVYGGDAWTPRFPRIGVKLNEKVVSRINKKAYELIDDRRLREIFSLSSEVYPDNIEKVISDYGVEGYYNKEWVKLAYLLDNGKKVKIPTKAKDYGIASEDIVRLAKEKGLSVKEIYEDYNFYKNNPDFVAQVKEARDEARLSSIPEEQRDEMRERMQSRPLSEAAFDSYIRGALEMENDLAHGGLKEIVDRQALRDLIEKKVKTDNAEYNKWVDNLFEGIVEKRGIRNNRDWYTPSGNLRPWGQLYDPATPANILKYMLAENEQGGSGGFFNSNIMGASAETYESIEEIREKGKKRLKQLPYEEYDGWSNSIADRMAKICDDFLSPSQKNSMGGAIDAKIEITNAVAKDKTAKGIYKHMKREYPNFTMEHAKQVEEIVKEIQEFATGYFEAKPQRLVSVNEVMVAVVPSNASKEIVDALKSNGIEVVAYKKGDEEARKRVVKRVSSSMGIRFRDGAPFFSNAERAVENIKQQKATPEQWLAMIKKDGGLKAGEDKWMGLSDWLNEQKAQGVKTLTKDEVLQFIRENQIEIEEVEYSGVGYDEWSDGNIRNVVREALGNAFGKEFAQDALSAFVFGYDDNMGVFVDYIRDDELAVEMYNAENSPRIEYNSIGWLSFDESGTILSWMGDKLAQLEKIETSKDKPINYTRLRYTTEGLDNKREIALVVPTIEPWNHTDTIHFGDAGEGRAVAWVRFGETTDEDGNRVLVIDEVQSKRHDEGRAKGYRNSRIREITKRLNELSTIGYRDGLTEDQLNEKEALEQERRDIIISINPLIAEKAKKLKNESNELSHDAFEDLESDIIAASFNLLNGVPDAPFDKNYHELIMKRMLRYAAENGFDKVAWTKGAQQAKRYNLGDEVGRVDVMRVIDSEYSNDNNQLYDVVVLDRGGEEYVEYSKVMPKDEILKLFGEGMGGIIIDAANRTEKGEFVGIPMHGYKIGDEGRGALYDEMIPRFMNKYTKKWGTKVGEVTLPEVEEAGRTMWSVDVTPEMRESVMQGQPMFREGMGAISDREVSYENDPIAKWQGKPRYYGKRAAAFAERERRRMENAAKEAAEMLGIEAEIVTDASTLQGRKAKAKGWYDIVNKKVVVVVPNHVSMGDAVRTVLHEGVAHHGLRELFGDGFDAMLDNVYNNVAPELKARIDAIAERTGVSTSVATEEYLASLAETTNFEEAQRRGWWQKIKSYFVDMLRKLSMPGLKLKEEITDNELRYLLWRSYKNLVEPNSYLRPLGYAEDVVKQKELKVGEYAEKAPATPMAADTSEAEEWAAVTMQRIEELEAQMAQLENEIAEMEADRDADDASRYEMWEQQLEPLRKHMEDVYAELEGLYSLEAEAEEMSMASEDAIRYRLVDDPAEIERLESEPTIKAYRAMQVINGELYPPMSAVVDGKLREPIAFGQWEQSEERPDLADDNGRFKLDKGNKKSLKAAYNPYFHSSSTPLNDQFSEAQDRDNLVTVEVEVPVSEADGTSGYKAEKAKDAVGTHQWKAGIIQGQLTGTREVFLTRWDKPIRIVPESEVADVIVEMFDGKDIVMPSNVVTPQLRKELEARGITFVETDNQGKLVEGEHKGEHYSKVYGKKADGLRYREDSVSLPNMNEKAEAFANIYRKSLDGDFMLPSYAEDAIENALSQIGDDIRAEHGGDTQTFFQSIGQMQYNRLMKAISNEGYGYNIPYAESWREDYADEAKDMMDEMIVYLAKERLQDAENVEKYIPNNVLSAVKPKGNVYKMLSSDVVNVLQNVTGKSKDEIYEDYAHEGDGMLTDEDFDALENNERTEIIAEVERESAALGVPVRIARSVDELPDEDTRKRAVDGKLKGYFDPRTVEVVVYEPNTNDANDAKRTILHEIVGHKGLRQLIGEQQYDKAMLQLMYMLPAEVRDAVLRRAERHGWNAAIAMDEYLAEQAERDVQPTWWGKVNAKIRALLRNLGYDVKLTDADVTYLLWRSRKKLQGDDLNDMAVNAILKQAARKSAEADAWNEQAFKDAEMRDFEQGAMQTLRHRIGDAQNEYDSTMKSMAFKQREAWQDSMRSLKVFMDILEKESGKKIVDFENAYMYENAMSSANLMEMQMFRHDVYGRLLKAIHEFMESGAKYEEVVDYMMAKHGLERNEKMARKRAEKEAEGDAAKEAELYAKYREEDLSGLTALTGVDNVADAEVAAMQMVTDFEAAHNTDLLWNETRACTQTILNISHDAGILSDEVYDELWNQYEYYIPLRGFDETTAEEMYTYVGDNKSPYNAPIKTARGRKSKADDPIATIATMAESAIVEANRNRLKQRFLYMVERHRTELASVSSVWVEKDPITGDCVARFANIPNDATPDEAAQAQKSFEERMEQLHEQEPERYYKASDKPNIPYRVEKKANEHEHQIIVKRNGKDVVITINGDPRVAQAINGLTNPEAVEGFSKFAGNVNRFLSANFTTRNPAFVVSNFVRDGFYTNSMVWVKEGPAYARRYNQNWIKATKLLPSLVSKYKKYESGDKSALDMSDPVERAFYEFMIHGGETGYTVINSVEDYKGIVSGDLRAMQGGVVGNAKKAMQAVGNMVDTFGRWAEDTSRFAAYMTSRQLGRTITKSIWDAKEISVNFNKKGSGRKMTQHDKGLNSLLGWMSQQGRNLYVFWNAGVQGLTNFGKAAKEHPGKMAGLVGAYFGLGMLVAAVFGGQDDDDDYYNLPEYVRRNNICHRVGDKWITLPLPIEIRAIYGMGELAMSWIAGKEDPKKIGMKIVQQVSQVAPIDMMAEGGGLKAFIPSWFKPIAEVYINTDWTGMPIYRERTPFNEYDPTWMLAFKSTSPEYVAVSRAINEATNENLPSGKENKYDRGWADSDYFNNPAAWEHVVEGYLGGLATTFNQTKKSVMALWNKNLREMRNIPVISRFVKSTPENEKNTLRNDYFEAKDEVDKLRAQRGRFRKESKNIDKSLTEEQLEDVLESLTEMEGMVNATISKWDELEKNRKSLEQILKEDPEKKITIKGKEWKVSDLLDGVTKEMITLVEAYRME